MKNYKSNTENVIKGSEVTLIKKLDGELRDQVYELFGNLNAHELARMAILYCSYFNTIITKSVWEFSIKTVKAQLIEFCRENDDPEDYLKLQISQLKPRFQSMQSGREEHTSQHREQHKPTNQ